MRENVKAKEFYSTVSERVGDVFQMCGDGYLRRRSYRTSNGILGKKAGSNKGGYRRIVYRGEAFNSNVLIKEYLRDVDNGLWSPTGEIPLSYKRNKATATVKNNSIVVNLFNWFVSVMTAKIKVKIYLER